MEGKLRISELSICREKDTGKQYLYGSFIEFYADTEEGLEKLTGVMLEKGLFDFGVIGRNQGLDRKANMYWTLDDGKPSMGWLAEVAGAIQEMNEGGDSLMVWVIKALLLRNEAVQDMTKEDVDVAEDMGKIIDIYMYYLNRAMENEGYGDVVKTQAPGKLHKEIPSRLEDGRIYVEI